MTTTVFAQKRVAVLPVQTGALVNRAERTYLTELLRGIAGNELNQSGFIVMDRENFQTILGAELSLEDCVGSCVVDTGQKLKAHYVVSAKLTEVFGSYRLILRVHATASGAQLRQLIIEIKDKPEFEARIKDGAPGLFEVILAHREGKLSAPKKRLTLKVETTPPQSLAVLNDKQRCETPCSFDVQAGPQHLMITKDGYDTETRRLNVDESVAISVVLKKPTAVVATEPTLPAEPKNQMPTKTEAMTPTSNESNVPLKKERAKTRGLINHFAIGLGTVGVTADDNAALESSGGDQLAGKGGVYLSGFFGGMVLSRLALGVSVSTQLANAIGSGTTLTIGNQTSTTENNAHVAYSQLGLGGRLYLKPDLFLHLSGGLGWVEYKKSSTANVVRSVMGTAGELGFGREYWITDQWLLGWGLQLFNRTVDVNDNNNPWQINGISLYVSGTLNFSPERIKRWSE